MKHPYRYGILSYGAGNERRGAPRLVVGFTTRHVVQSAYRAGYLPYAVDHFCDQDLSWYTKDRIRFDDLAEIPSCIHEMCERHPIDLMVVTSGAEQVASSVPLLGTNPQTIDQMLDKLETSIFFTNHGVPTPHLHDDGEYPAMLKPRRGAGGWRNRIVRNEEERNAYPR
jgi:predicted ATP-grasp superfamily ATP-dependent carboligase